MQIHFEQVSWSKERRRSAKAGSTSPSRSASRARQAHPSFPSQYFFQTDDQLAWSSNTNGPEEIFDQGKKGPVPELLKASEDPTWKAPKPTDNFDDIWFRTERQTLRRMPKTGCILFTIRYAEMTSLVDAG